MVLSMLKNSKNQNLNKCIIRLKMGECMLGESPCVLFGTKYSLAGDYHKSLHNFIY